MNRLIATSVFLVRVVIPSAAQEPLSAYKSRTLAELAELNRTAIEAASKKADPGKDSDLNGTDPYYSVVQLQFQGAARPIGEGRKKLIGNWVKSLKLDRKITESYVNELKFSEGNEEYWIGIPNNLISSIAGKVKKGESVSLYLSYAGSFKPKDENRFEPVLIITAIQ